ncbi:MAG: glycoside hydrolase family 88 protein [Planctomycetota bacterium]|nr:glycoside hydrolase family 88 protein [Planctomycetota bacterium]
MKTKWLGRLCLGLAAIPLVIAGLGAARVSGAPTTWPSLKPSEITASGKDAARHFGDAPDDGGPLATDLSGDLKSADILKATKKVGDWELARHEHYFGQNWCWGALYTGFMGSAKGTGNPEFRDAMLAVAEKFHWKLASQGLKSADDICLAQTYLELYQEQEHPDPQRIAFTKTALDALYNAPPPSGHPLPWWWCDALYMGPSVWIGMYKVTGDVKYLDYMNKNWWATSDLLYDKDEHLYARDAGFIGKTEANGKKIFWSRGEGWVMGGLARIIPLMPADFADRGKYIAQFKEMAARIITLQGDDGLWRAGLLDPDAYVIPENSGSSFFTFALAWGINAGYLDKATYEPVVAKAWAGLVSNIYADGRLGCIQQTGAAPAHFKPTSSYCYGIGAFLLAGNEVNKLALEDAKHTRS